MLCKLSVGSICAWEGDRDSRLIKTYTLWVFEVHSLSQLESLWPYVLSGRAKYSYYPKYLIYLRRTAVIWGLGNTNYSKHRR